MLSGLLIGFLSLYSAAQSSPIEATSHCNGEAKVVAGDPTFANGRPAVQLNESFYPTGTQVVREGNVVYPNGQRLEVAGDEFFMSGQKVMVSGEMFYPNGQRVQISGECFFQSGAKMPSCPKMVRYEEKQADLQITGTLDLDQLRIVERKFELREPKTIITWNLKPSGELADLKSACL